MHKTIAIMQPYFLPYIGYWQLMAAVDEFVVYDNIQYVKKGWINRNRCLNAGGEDELFSIPLRKDSDYLNIKDRCLSYNFEKDASKLLRKINSTYRKAPNFDDALALFEKCLMLKDRNLFNFIFHSINVIKDYLDINTKLLISSDLDVDPAMRSSQKVRSICSELNAARYINPIGGIELYLKHDFKKCGVELLFHKALPLEYKQFGNDFIPWLSIIDIIMFNSKQELVDSKMLDKYELL